MIALRPYLRKARRSSGRAPSSSTISISTPGAARRMNGAEQDPVAMMAELARGMKPERRARFLDAACGGNPAMRAAVEARLASFAPTPEPPLPEDATLTDGMLNLPRPAAEAPREEPPGGRPEDAAEPAPGGDDEPAPEPDFLDSLALEALSDS